MKTFQFKGILTELGWISPAIVTVNKEGNITYISNNDNITNTCQTSTCVDKTFDAYVIPGFQNAHSHAFQYAMAGLAEIHSTDKTPDDFWSWRDSMYQLALSISPDDLEAIATQLYAEMLRLGYTNVAEFHYVHHHKNGETFSNLSEMGERLIAAAKKTGIGITLVPIFYQKGGFGKAASESQKRFISTTIDDYKNLLDASKKSAKFYEHANVAIGIHSMRAVKPKDIIQVAQQFNQNLPFHIHIAEQLKEIEDSINYLKQRPVEWFLNHIETNERFHFVHATHLTDSETKSLAKSNANVVLCPSTEGNLGDGLFPLKNYQKYGGHWSIGTDSHVGLNPLEELRILDYGQRLTSHKRNTFYSKHQGDSGTYAIDMALKSGRKAMNNYEKDYFKVGQPFDAVMFDASHPLIKTTSEKNLTSTLVYATDSSMIKGTFSKGKLVVKEGKHINFSNISNDFVNTMSNLQNR
jgi:formimidoylglutamate deiminase